MAGRGNAAGSWLESANTAKVGGCADGASAVAANSAHGAAGGDGSGFATARAAGGVSGIPRVRGFAGEAVVGFIGHQEFGRIGIAEEDAASVFEAGDEGRVGCGDVILSKKRARGARPAGYVETGFYGKGNPFEGAEGFSTRDAGFGIAGASTGGFGVYVNEGIELGLNLVDAVEVGGDEFDGRNLHAAKFFEGFGDAGINRLGHGGRKKGNELLQIGQGELEN